MEKKTYDWVLFDADDTLFHFDAFTGLQRLFSSFDVLFTGDDYAQYQTINQTLWDLYQQGKIGADDVKKGRFEAWGQRLQREPDELNTAFLEKMLDVSVPLEGSHDLLISLAGHSKLGIITNGFTQLQESRLLQTGFNQHFELVVVSEEVGFAKPHKAIFDYALSKMGQPLRESVLMVGDNPFTDILGGLNAGFDTCWLNVHKKPRPSDIEPHYEVASLKELQSLILKN